MLKLNVTRRRVAFLALSLAVLAGVLVWWVPKASAQAIPMLPVIYSGTVTVGGAPAPDGLQIVGRILDYQSQPVLTSGGEYANLTVAPQNSYQFQTLAFFILGFELKADQEVAQFPGGLIVETINLTFPALPQPTPTPTPTPTATSIPTPTPRPTATATPPPTATSSPTPTTLPQSEEKTATVDTTISGSTQQFQALQQSVTGALGSGVEVTEAPIEITSGDQGLVIELPATGLTQGQQVVGALNATLGSLSLETTDGTGTATIDLGAGLSVEAGVDLEVTDTGIDVVLQDPQLLLSPETPDAESLAGGSDSVTDIGVDFQVGLDNLPDGASLSVQFAKEPEAFVDRPGVIFQFAAQEVGGIIEDPQEDIAFLVGVTKEGITNDDLGTNVITMTVSKAWYDQLQAEGKDMFITKLDDQGNVFTVMATSVVKGDIVECTAEFTDEAGGFSSFVLVSIVGGQGQAMAPPSPTPVPAIVAIPTSTAVLSPTPVPTSTSASSGVEIPGPAIGGIAGGVVVLVVLAVLGGYFLGRRRVTAG